MLLSRATCTALHVAELSLASKLCPRHVCWCRWAHLPGTIHLGQVRATCTALHLAYISLASVWCPKHFLGHMGPSPKALYIWAKPSSSTKTNTHTHTQPRLDVAKHGYVRTHILKYTSIY